MGFSARLTSNGHVASGNLDTNVAGTFEAANSLSMNRVVPGSLSAHCVVDIETTSLTMTLNWQVSLDNSTWLDIAHTPNNAAGVVLGTGTAGADPTITKVLPAPDSVYSYPYCRCGITNAGATGAAADTYAIGYSYRKPSGF